MTCLVPHNSAHGREPSSQTPQRRPARGPRAVRHLYGAMSFMDAREHGSKVGSAGVASAQV